MGKVLEQLHSGLREWVHEVPRYIEATLNETVARVAVTGLSRSGKTVFMTSLIHNVLALGHGRNALPLLQIALHANGTSRLRKIRISPPGAATIPLFDFDDKLARLASGTPAWPARTEDLAQITLEMEIERVNPVTQKLGAKRVRLELLDYPGEWLLDLPLLSRSYCSWSEETLAFLRQPARQTACADFLQFLTSIHPTDRAEDAVIRRGHELYRAALQALRTRLGLRYLQPGRFLCPGPWGEAPFMWFFPLAEAKEHFSPHSVGELLRERFEAYQRAVRDQFFDMHFGDFNRQIVLVDVLSALHGGKEAFDDTERAIADIAAHLDYGSNWLPKFRGRRIERIAFVATKADHVPSMRRENLKNLLRAIGERARPASGFGERPVTFHAVASVLSTIDSTATFAGRPVEVVLGLPFGEEQRRPFYAGDVPSGRPPDSFWSDQFFQLPVFAPPKIDPSGRAGIPQLGIDEVLVEILGDALR